MLDYRQKIADLIQQEYYFGTPENYSVKFTTSMLYIQLCSIIPVTAFDEFDVTEILEELGHKPQYETKIKIVEREVEGKKNLDGTPYKEKDELPYDDFVFYWYFLKK